ncbi:MAG: hypothetical protein ABFC84_17675, partial [Veillonellales bacterium]
LADYNTAAYRDGKKSVIGLDQFGLTYTRDHMVYKIGRQDATVGTTALLYSRSDSNVGKHYFVDGISASGKIGAMDISALLAQEDNAGPDNNRIYAIRTGYSPRDDFNFGLTLGRYHYDGGENTNHWAVDGTRSFGKHSLTAEYAKSNSSNENKAYAATWNYNCDAKTALYITGFRVETNGDMGQQSDFDNDNRGVYYGVTHQFSDADGVELTYKQQKTISGGQDNTKFEATFTHSF